MLRKNFVLLVVGTMIFFLCSISSADVPDSINYQGKLTTASGGCLNGTVEMTFTIYSDDQGASSEWSETQTEVEVKEGIFNVFLGSVNPLPASLFDGSVKYLGVQMESDEEMRPLKPMVSVPYAYRAGTADGGGGGGWVDDGTVVRLVDSTDYVGIGTTNPQGPLQVGETFIVTGLAKSPGRMGVNETTPDAVLEVNQSTETCDLLMLSSTAAGDGDRLIVKSSGNVGIGTQNPTGRLHVEDADGWAGYFDGAAYFSDFVEVGDGDRLGLLGKVYGHGYGWIPTRQEGPVHGLIGIMHCEEGWVPGYGVLGIVDGSAGIWSKGRRCDRSIWRG